MTVLDAYHERTLATRVAGYPPEQVVDALAMWIAWLLQSHCEFFGGDGCGRIVLGLSGRNGEEAAEVAKRLPVVMAECRNCQNWEHWDSSVVRHVRVVSVCAWVR